MTDDSQLINDVITRWKGRQSIRAMARDLGFSRTKMLIDRFHIGSGKSDFYCCFHKIPFISRLHNVHASG